MKQFSPALIINDFDELEPTTTRQEIKDFLVRISPLLARSKPGLLEIEEEWDIFWIEMKDKGCLISPNLPSELWHALINYGFEEY